MTNLEKEFTYLYKTDKVLFGAVVITIVAEIIVVTLLAF